MCHHADFLGLCQTATGVKSHSALVGVVFDLLSRVTKIVLVQEGGSWDTFRVKQHLAFWITAYGVSSYLLYKCGVAPHCSSLWSWLQQICCLAEAWSLCFPIPLWRRVDDVSFLLPFPCTISLNYHLSLSECSCLLWVHTVSNNLGPCSPLQLLNIIII